jgi:ABC-2 type transport system ATP-binding protein
MIELEGVTKSYGNVPAVRDVTFRVNRGEILLFLGPNGAVETTTIQRKGMLYALVPPGREPFIEVEKSD